MAFFDRMNQTMTPGPTNRRGLFGDMESRARATQGNFAPSNAYREAIPQQAGDYDEIMEGYRGMLGPGNDGGFGNVISRIESQLGQGGKFNPAAYTEAPEWAESYGKLRDLTNTGGLSEQEQGSLRARAISPIRSVYENMTRNMDRQRRLQGGFSPNYNASAARMAREGSEQIAQTTTNANAAIAEMVQKGKLAMAPEMARLAADKNALMNKIALENSANELRSREGNASLLAELNKATQAKNNRANEALQGMTSLYGTTPALVDTFGKQVQNQQQINNQNNQAMAENQTRRQTAALGGGMRSGGFGRFGGY